MTKIILKKNDQGYRYFEMGSECHGKISYRVYVAKSLIKTDNEGNEFIELPCRASFKISEKGTKTLIPGENFVIDIFIKCGYRGNSSFEVVEKDAIIRSFPYYDYDSPLGNLGISSGALIEINGNYKSIRVKWNKTGRTYGKPKEGAFEIDLASGEIKDIEDPDEEEFLEEALNQ